MNKYLKIIVVAFGVFAMASCADPDLSPIITFDQAGKGGYPRLTQLVSGEYDLNNAGSTAFAYEIELVDLEQGKLTSSYSINVKYVDNNAGNGDNTSEITQYKTFSQSDFGTSGDGFKNLSVSIPLTELVSLLSLNTDDLLPGDLFDFSTNVTVGEGASAQVFTFDNSSAAVNGPAFQGFFDFTGKLTCPIDDSRFSGTYRLEYIGTPSAPFGDDPFGDLPANYELSTVAGSTTLREFAIPNLGSYTGSLTTMRVDFVCTTIDVLTATNGGNLACGGDPITLGKGDVSPFDYNDDSEFTINFVDFETDGGCGVPPQPFTIKFTKQ